MGPVSVSVSVSEPLYTNSSQLSQSEQEHEHEPDQMQQPHNKSPLKCPRCDSTNTKFCYYNNYSRLQPRHFCRACRRHWTAGGTLRDVPFGGARKYTKRRKMSPSAFTAGPSAAATSTATTSESLTDTNNTSFPFVEPLFLQAQLPPLEYGIGSIFNEIGCNTGPVFVGSSYDVMNLYNEEVGPAWQLPDISAAGCWQDTNDQV